MTRLPRDRIRAALQTIGESLWKNFKKFARSTLFTSSDIPASGLISARISTDYLFSPGALHESRQVADACGKSAVSVRRSQLRDAQGRLRPLVADVDLLSRIQPDRSLPLSLGRRDRNARRHAARVRRTLCATAAVSVYGERQGKRADAQRLEAMWELRVRQQNQDLTGF